MSKAVYASLQAVQRDLKAPKGQFNSFGKYKYRSCEDIVEAVKPLLNENGLILLMSDRAEVVAERVYIVATCKVVDVATGDCIEVQALAREPLEKKGMDTSQVTGTASSYARKYALNGLFAIDDTKDADTNEYTAQTSQNAPQSTQNKNKGNCKADTEKTQNDANDKVRQQAVRHLNSVIEGKGIAKETVKAMAEKITGKHSVRDMTDNEIIKLCEALEYEE